MTDEQQEQLRILAAVNVTFYYWVPGADLLCSEELTVHDGIEKWLRLQCLNENEKCILPFIGVSLSGQQDTFVTIPIGEAYRALPQEYQRLVYAAVLEHHGQDAADVVEQSESINLFGRTTDETLR